MFRVLGMGNALTDVLIQINSDDILNELNLPKGSMHLIDHDQFKNIQARISGMNVHLVCGGSAANAITGLAKMGIPTGFIFKIHQDEIGDNYCNDLESYGTAIIALEDEQPSGRSLVFITPDGERTFATYLGAAAAMVPQDLNIEMFVGYDIFYTEGYLVQNHGLIETALKMAKGAGLMVALDLASYNVVESDREFLKSLIDNYVDMVFANEEESKALTGLDPEDSLLEIARYTGTAIVKLGDKGAMAIRGNEFAKVPAVLSKCVDSTGAGDLFASGFIFGLSSGRNLNDCLRLGTISAGKVIENIGPKIDDSGWKKVFEDFKLI
jgi:sugar/nucleoside kinase (ribokinase family)